MQINFSLIGLGIIVVSWIVQIVHTIRVGKVMSPIFAIMQSVGVAFLVVSSVTAGTAMAPLDYLNAASSLGGLIMFVLLIKCCSKK